MWPRNGEVDDVAQEEECPTDVEVKNVHVAVLMRLNGGTHLPVQGWRVTQLCNSSQQKKGAAIQRSAEAAEKSELQRVLRSYLDSDFLGILDA